jgi:Zn-dependent M28 family amino/carboxypeptidase
MPRHLALIATILALVAASWLPSPSLTTPITPALAEPVAAETAPAFSGASAQGYVNALAEQIGSRSVGSANEGVAQQYLLTRYRELGYQAELQQFPVTSYDDRGSTLTLAGPLGQTYSAATLQYSTGGDVEGEVVQAGLGRPEDFEDAGAAGKIALVQRGDTRFVDKANAAAEAGVRALIIANNQPGNFSGSLIGVSSIPVISISQSDGQELQRAIRAGGATVRVTVDASVQNGTAANVVATRPGGSQTIVIGGHFDSVEAGPGANDNGSGTAVTLELARVLAQRQTPFTLKFVAFDAEEIGLVGSNYFVSQLSDQERQSVVAMINLDMVGVGTETRLGGSSQLTSLARSSAMALGESAGSMGEAPGGSDHTSFLRAGIPALFIYRSNDPNYHSPNDLARYVDPANLELAGRIALDVVSGLERAS